MFKKGQSGNPSGHQRRRLITSAIERILVQSDGTKAREIAENVLEMALAGDKWAIQFVTERTEGSPEQHVNITRSVRELADDELIEIARGGDRATITETSPEAPQPLH